MTTPPPPAPTATVPDAEAYAARVRAALADLPPAAREDLLADLGDHLAEVAGEDPGRPLADLLGPPEDYAAELRSSAGLAPAGGAAAAARGPGGLRGHRWVTATREFLPELVPGWWVLRAALLAGLLTAVLGGGVLLWLLLTAVLVPLSVTFGRWVRADRGRRPLGIIADVVAVLVAVGVLGLASGGSGSSPVVQEGVVVPGSDRYGLEGVTNLFPYSPDGRPLTDVLLYDQDGNPVELRPDWDAEGNPITRVPRYDTGGRVVGNAYPQEQTVEVDSAGGDGTTVRRVPPPVVRPPALQPR